MFETAITNLQDKVDREGGFQMGTWQSSRGFYLLSLSSKIAGDVLKVDIKGPIDQREG